MLNWKQHIKRAAELKQNRSWNETAELLSQELGVEIHPERLRGALRRANVEVIDTIPSNLQSITEAPIHLENPNFFYASDFHVPFHSVQMARRLRHLAEHQYSHISTLVVGGDFFDMGAASFHLHDEAQPITLEEEMKVGGDLLFELMHYWQDIVILSGNHDVRIQRKLGTAFNLERLVFAALAGRDVATCTLHISNYDWLTAGTNWLMGHPSNFSGRGGQVPVDIALIKQTNVIGAHNHRFGIQASACGKFIGIDPGCMTDGPLHWYKERRLNKYNEWVKGFVIVENGYPKTFTELFTDWGALNCE